MQINLGSAVNDGTGNPLRTGGLVINQYGLLNDKTIDAAFYKTASITNEAAINLAIPAAKLLGTGAAVRVPASMLPYTASLVTFDTAVTMLREGGYPRYIDLVAYGADGSGSGTLCDASFIAAKARLNYLYSNNLGASMPSAGASIYAPAGTYYVSATIDLATGGNYVAGLIGDGPRLTRFVTSVTTTAGINACSYSTSFTVLRGFSLFQSALTIPGSQRGGNYGIRNTAGVGFQMLIDEVEVNYFANSGIFIEGPTGPTVISNCSIQFNAGWGLEASLNVNSPQNLQVLAGNIHNCWGGVKGNGINGCQFHALDVELGSSALWPCIYLTGASYGNSFYECTVSAQPLQALVGPSNGIVVIDSGIGNTFINGINTAGNNQGTDNYRLVGACDRTTIIGGNHTNSSTTGGFFAVIQGTNTTIIDPLVNASTYQATKNTVSEGSGVANFTTIIGTGTNGPLGTAGIAIGSSSLSVGRRIIDGESALTSGTTPALDASLGNYFTLNITSNIAVVVAVPTNFPSGTVSQEMVVAIRNGSGGVLTTPPTFNTGAQGFKFPAGVIVNPGNGLQVLYTFRWDAAQGFWYLMGAPTTVGY